MFAGIGGFRTGLTNAGDLFLPVGWCEIDRFCQKAYRALYGTGGEYFSDDATKIDTEELPDIDLICGGFPCQPFSVSGRRRGFDDTRGTLFHEIVRVAESKRPQYLLLENVPGLLNHNGGKTFGTIIRAIHELGYCLEWCVLNSADFGVPQQRKRVYIVSVFKIIQELLAPGKGRNRNQFQQLMEKLPADHKAKWFAGAALNTAEQSMASVMSTALSRLNAFLDSELETILCNDTEIDAERFCKEKSAIFIIMPEEDSSKYFMVSLLIQQLYREILAVADENGGKLKNRVVFYCDEFGTLPKIESAEMMFSASRSRRVSIVPIIQSFAQLEKNYGKEGAEIIIDNTQLTVFGGFAPNSESAQTLSKALGSKTVLSGSVSQSKGDPSRSLQMIERPLMTPDELKALPKGTFVVTKTGFYPMKVKLKLFFKWGIEFEKEPYVVPMRDASTIAYASREALTEAIQAKYPLKEKKDDDDTIPDGSICVEEEMAMQNSPKLNTKPHKPEVKQ